MSRRKEGWLETSTVVRFALAGVESWAAAAVAGTSTQVLRQWVEGEILSGSGRIAAALWVVDHVPDDPATIPLVPR